MSCSPFFRKFPNSVLHQKESKHNKDNKVQNVRCLTLKTETSLDERWEIHQWAWYRKSLPSKVFDSRVPKRESMDPSSQEIHEVNYFHYNIQILSFFDFLNFFKAEANYTRVTAVFPGPSWLYTPLESQIIMSLVGPRILFSGRALAYLI